jgi:hypothetical protein
MHTNKTYRFEDETTAQDYANRFKVDGRPARDTYVYGPYFIDEAVVLANIPGAGTEKYWTVQIEKFS